jgi:dinuclear metal center YbgI/SA1388 family protein
MSIRVADICRVIEKLAPEGYAWDWDRPGLSTGSLAGEVKGVLVCLSPTREALLAARRADADMLVSHHPLIFKPLRHLREDDPQVRLYLEFLEAGIAAYAAHTNLDVVPGGVNHLLAENLGLNNLQPLLPVEHARQYKLVTFVPETHLADLRNALAEAGAGIIGAYTHCSFHTPGTGAFLPGADSDPYTGEKGVVNEEPELRFEMILPAARKREVVQALFKAHPYEEVAYDLVPIGNTDPGLSLGLRGELEKPVKLREFARGVCRALKIKHARVMGSAGKNVRNIAVIGGSGGGEAASLAGDIDVLVTGDVRYHDALDARQKRLAIIDAGHAGTEKAMVPAMAKYLRDAFPKLKVTAWTEPEIFTVVSG